MHIHARCNFDSDAAAITNARGTETPSLIADLEFEICSRKLLTFYKPSRSKPCPRGGIPVSPFPLKMVMVGGAWQMVGRWLKVVGRWSKVVGRWLEVVEGGRKVVLGP